MRPVWMRTFFALVVCPTSAVGGELLIGMSADFTGPSRALGIELYRGTQAYLEKVNRTGGVHGNTIRILACDDKYNPQLALKNTVRLLERDNVLLLYGYVGTPTVARVLPLLKLHEKRAAYLFFPFTGAEMLRAPPYDQFVFNLRASYLDETAELVEHFLRLGKKRIAVFYQVDAYGRSGWSGVRAALARHDLQIAAEATYYRGTGFDNSMKPQAEILLQSNPDAIICIGSYAACAALTREIRESGSSVPLANVSFVGSESLLALLLESGRKSQTNFTANLFNSQVVPSYENQALSAVGEYRASMEKYRPDPPTEFADPDYLSPPLSFVGFEGYLNAKLLVEVLRAAGPNPDRSKLRLAAESIRDFDLGIGVKAAFGPGQHQAIHKVYLTTARDERFLPLLGK